MKVCVKGFKKVQFCCHGMGETVECKALIQRSVVRQRISSIRSPTTSPEFHYGFDISRLPKRKPRVGFGHPTPSFWQTILPTRYQEDLRVTQATNWLLTFDALRMRLNIPSDQCTVLTQTPYASYPVRDWFKIRVNPTRLDWLSKTSQRGGRYWATRPPREGSVWDFLSRCYLRCRSFGSILRSDHGE